MRFQEDGGAKSKQIWTIPSHWCKPSLSEELLLFLNANFQLVKRDIATAVIYYYTTTESHCAKGDYPLSEYGGVNIEVNYLSTKISKFWLTWAKIPINASTHT